MNIFLETKRLIIKTPELTDFDNLYILQSDPDVMRYIGHGVRTKEQVAESLQKSIDHQKKHGFSLGNVYEKETGTFVGRAGLIYLAFDDTQPEIEVGYALLAPYWNKGYATELSSTLIKWGFDHLSIDHLVGVIRPQNERSGRVLEKSGMKYIKNSLYNNIEVKFYQIDKSVFDLCPCGSNKEYLMCCGLYIEQQQLPRTPEQLMRSRYTAYTKANIDYIRKTMQGLAALRFDYDSARNRTEQVQWLRLEVLQSYIDLNNKNRGFVEFKAYYSLANQEHCLHELSEFHLQDGQWFYVDGKHEFKSSNKININRNDPCICGSGKKYKKCCGQ